MLIKKGVKVRKRGQVTLFIILGIVLLSALGMYVYFTVAAQEEAEVISAEASPVIVFVESCMMDIAREGITTLGFNGGYITFPAKIERNPMTYLAGSPIKDLMNPYWWYDGIEAIPTEGFIKIQLGDYVSRELRTCLNNFEDLKDYEIRELGPVSTVVELTVEDVVVKVDYPLVIKKGEDLMRKEDFRVEVPVRLKKTYELAKRIMERENRDTFLEKKTIDLISMDPEIPISDIAFTCEPRKWLLEDVKAKIQRLLRVNLPYIRIEGTRYGNTYVPNPYGDRYNTSYYNYHYIWDVEVEELEDFRVSFTYDDKWPMAVFARPSRNGILSSNAEKGQEMLAFFCMHIWHFTYDIIYPVMVDIVDERTREHDRFRFRFPFKVSVNHNQPYRKRFGHMLLEGSEKAESEEYCTEARNEVTIYTSDKATQEPVADVDITLVCGRFRCDIGKSEWVGYGAGAGLTKRMPYCTQALLIGSKEGYAESKTFIQTDLQGKTYNLDMVPIKEIDEYYIEKHPSSVPALGDIFREGEKAVITISVPEKNFESYGVYPITGNVPLKFLSKEDNTYKVSIYVTKGEDLLGGYIGDWTVTKEQLAGAERAVFHTIISDAKTEDERFLFLSGLESYSEQVPGPELR
ncbi:hypothetical protein KY360_05430 [Candidatus Woesearchaeota archaeon]|nr:hypothetical protein [Candidatus Woesearchaeota archaeon]